MVFCLGMVNFSCNPSNPVPLDSERNHETGYPPIAEVFEDYPDSFGWGRLALQKEIDSLSVTVFPDGTGLPKGSGNAVLGKSIYIQKCAACHGISGYEGPEEILVVPIGEDKSERKPKTVGNYWPYATTLFDYIRRAMPTNAPGSLTDEEVYSLTAWLLFANGIIEESRVINRNNLPLIQLPNQFNFKPDDRTTGPSPIY